LRLSPSCFSLIFYFLALTNKWLTGGDDGINFTLPPTINAGGLRMRLH
jgi:branched-chain amino acid transport system permease protein